MIAFDLDGVFVGDISPNMLCPLEEMLKTRLLQSPVFQPNFDFYIITGRPVIDKDGTLTWIEQFFQVKPTKIFHENLNIEDPIKYKSRVLAENPEITVFVESDYNQMIELQKLNPNVRVFLFNDLLNYLFCNI